jgi:phosphoenolpyruvate carboxylase
VQPTFTAHPTEARRRSILDKQRRIAELLQTLRNPLATTDETADAVDALFDQVILLLATDENRAERPTVQDEVQQGLYFLVGTVWETAPIIHRDVERALERHFPEAYDAYTAEGGMLPVFLHWRSWIGSDRDGNPNVTADVTRWALQQNRNAVLDRYEAELLELREELSISSRQAPASAALTDAVSTLDAQSGMTDDPAFRHEPYRRLITHMIRAIAAQRSDQQTLDWNATRFSEHLDLMFQSLTASGFGAIARHGRLARLRVLIRTFGFHRVAMDVRQHSRIHQEAVAALLAAADVCADYAALDEDEKVRILAGELRNPRPLLARGSRPAGAAQLMLESFDVIRTAIEREPDSIGSYIISMTDSVSDILEPMLLAKEAGVWRLHDGLAESQLDFVPLFETIDDLAAAADRMTALFTHPVYALQLEARGQFQEIMLGYSDSNKDGGYWMANWALNRAQRELGSLCRRHNIDLRLFHGRGGSVGRGGGGANLAITAMPDAVHNGRIRVTEQGEVISFRYALKDIAHRHTEQLVSATLLALARADFASAGVSDDRSPADIELLQRIADASMQEYRTLIDDPSFWDWFIHITPIEQISRLPIASRPVSRGGGQVDFDGLRAIPWVFSWTQTRYLVPGWFGMGQPLTDALAIEDDAERLRNFYREWPFFRVLIDNAQREMARARPAIAARYAALADSHSNHHARIIAEFDAARDAMTRITEHDDLLEFSDVIRKSIALRNPYTDVLNLLQIELLRRAHDGSASDATRHLLFLSINGIAAAMQSTG